MKPQNNFDLNYITGLEDYFLPRLNAAEIETLLSRDPLHLFKTLQQYREYTEPTASSWQEYCLSLFHLIGVSPTEIAAGVYSLAGINGHLATLFVVADYQNQKTLGGLASLGWSIVSDGREMKICHSEKKKEPDKIIFVELEQILVTDSLIDFRALVVLLTKVMQQDPDAGSGIGKKPFDHYYPFFITPYAHEFATIRTLTNVNQFTVSTNFMAPHKVVLLLAVMDGVLDGFYDDGAVRIDQALLNNVNAYWDVVSQKKFENVNVVYPFYYFKSSTFWRLVPTSGNEERLSTGGDILVMSKLKELVAYAQLDLALVETLRNPTYFEELLNVLLMTYFNEQTAAAIRTFRANNT